MLRARSLQSSCKHNVAHSFLLSDGETRVAVIVAMAPSQTSAVACPGAVYFPYPHFPLWRLTKSYPLPSSL